MFKEGMNVKRYREQHGEWETACTFFRYKVDDVFTIKEVTPNGIVLQELLTENGTTAPGTSIKQWRIQYFKIVNKQRKSHLPEWW